MNHSEILAMAKAVGVNIRAKDGYIIASPKEALTDDLRALIRANKSALLEVLTSPATPVTDVTHPIGGEPRNVKDAQDERRDRVVSLLRASAGARLAFIVADDTTDPVVVAIARRYDGLVATYECEIPKAKYDGMKLLELADQHGGKPSSEFAVIDGGRSSQPTSRRAGER